MEYTSRIFSFLACKIDFQASILYLGSCIEIKKNINFLGTVDSKAQEFDKAG